MKKLVWLIIILLPLFSMNANAQENILLGEPWILAFPTFGVVSDSDSQIYAHNLCVYEYRFVDSSRYEERKVNPSGKRVDSKVVSDEYKFIESKGPLKLIKIGDGIFIINPISHDLIILIDCGETPRAYYLLRGEQKKLLGK
ncbi:MAG: hypothetical protein PHO89_09620 [Methylacidiphilaceae bacterium]|nr:hypothetical protein [Candidatus Methylacidiphilaceae bacterium]